MSTTCLIGPAFSITGEQLAAQPQAAFSVGFDDPEEQSQALAYEWYLDGFLVQGYGTAQFFANVGCGSFVLGVRVLFSEGWSGVRTLHFETCAVPSATTLEGPGTINEGASAQFSVIATYFNGSTVNLTGEYTFTSAIENDQFQQSAGTFSGSTLSVPGNPFNNDSRWAIVSATRQGYPTLTRRVFIDDTSPVVMTSIQLTGPDSVREGGIVSYTAVARYTNRSTRNITGEAVFTVSDPGKATVNGNSIRTLNTPAYGSSVITVTASFEGVTGQRDLLIIDELSTGVVVIDLFNNTSLTAIGFVENAEVAAVYGGAYTGRNIIPGGGPENAVILASDKITNQALSWRFEFNIARLVAEFPSIQQFTFAVNGRGSSGTLLRGAVATKRTASTMVMRGNPGSYLPSVANDQASGPSQRINSHVSAGANGTYNPSMPSLVKVQYTVATGKVTVINF